MSVNSDASSSYRTDRLFQHLQHRYMSEHTTLLTSPLFSRQYQLNLSMLTLQREAALRQVALLHAHQVEGARKSYESEVAKVEDEAKQARKLVRERLTAAVEDRRKKLKEEKEGGEGGIGEYTVVARRLAKTG